MTLVFLVLKSPFTFNVATRHEGEHSVVPVFDHTIAIRIENHTTANYLKPAFYTELRGSPL